MRGTTIVDAYIVMLFQLVVVCAVQNAHYSLLSACIGDQLLLGLHLGVGFRTELLVADEGNMHAWCAAKDCLFFLSKLLLYPHLVCLPDFRPGLHVLN